MDIHGLFETVAMALGRGISVEEFDDRLILQMGCYILNYWGCGPSFRFDMYVCGPYSSSLADGFYRIRDITITETEVQTDTVGRLRHILEKGLPYVEAYTTLMMIRENSPNATIDGITKRAHEL